jgi:outer membrane protein OmpA-like peptidoglycan-associated protein/tetratricopeptide (TPR) repeat protein
MVVKKKLNHLVIFRIMRFKKIVCLFLVLTSVMSNAQSRLEKVANEEYNNFNYNIALNKFTKIDPKNIEIWRKMAYSNEVLGKYKESEMCWKKVAESGFASGEDMYQYAQALKYSKKYEESQAWLKKASEKMEKDTRIQRNLSLEQGNYSNLLKDQGNATVKLLSMNTEDEDFSPTLMGNQVVFASTRTIEAPVLRKWNWNGLPFLELYSGDVAPDDNIVNVRPFSSNLKGKYHEGPSAFNAQGDYVIYTRNNYEGRDKTGARGLQLFSAQKNAKGKWSKPVGLNINSSDYSVGHPALSADGKMLYFVSDMPGGFGGTDIYKSIRNSDGSWSKPVNLGKEINTEGNEMFPFYHESGMLYFASNGHQGLGGLDVFVAKFGDNRVESVLNLGVPVNSSFDDFGFILKQDMKKGYFSSNRSHGKGNDDIYSVNVLKMWKFEKPIIIEVKDSLGNIIANQVIAIDLGEKGKVTGTTDAKGQWSTDALTWTNTVINVERPGFFVNEKNIDFNQKVKGDVISMVLNPLPIFDLFGIITDKSNNAPIGDVKVILTNLKTGEKKEIRTGKNGEIDEKVKSMVWTDTVKYSIAMSKPGYLGKEVKYESVLVGNGKVKFNDKADLSMEPIKVGTDLGKLIQINPIYFDLGKYDIRPDAALELDKVVAIMNTNPTMKIELGSHTDCRGSKASNMTLSDNRAKASAEYIKSRITDPSRINGKGYGESKLVNKCECEGKKESIVCTEEEHQANRRTEFKIVKI